jgi:class 3 adenylate cyclase
VGRGTRNAVVLTGPLVSKTHAKVVVEHDGSVTVHDLDSHNGTFVNGEKIRSRLLCAGDQIHVGGFQLTLEGSATDERPDPAADTSSALPSLNEMTETQSEDPAAVSQKDLRTALLSVLPEELAEHVLSSATGQAWVSPQVRGGQQAVAFFELHGFDTWAAKEDGSEVARVVAQVIHTAASVAGAFGGRLEQHVGAGGFVRFCEGVPAELAEAALRAVLELRVRVVDVLGAHALSLRVRAGLDIGEVLAGLFSHGSHVTYTMVGTPVRLAERITQVAAPGDVLMSARFRHLLQAQRGWRPVALGPHAFHGRPDPVDLFRVDGAQAGSG